MKRYLLITLNDGAKHQVDLEGMVRAMKKINPVKDEFLQAAMGTAQCGFLDETITPRLVWIAPSRIKEVEIIFDDKLSIA